MHPSFVLAAAVAALSASASAQIPTDVGQLLAYVNKNLTSQCVASLLGAYNSAEPNCGTNLTSSWGLNSIDVKQLQNTTYVQSLMNASYNIAQNSPLLNATCSDSCEEYLNKVSDQVKKDCSSQNLLASDKLPANFTLTAPDVFNSALYARRAICVSGDNSTFCVQDQIAAFEQDYPATSLSQISYQQVLANTNITGLPCALKEVKELKKYSSLRQTWQDMLAPIVKVYEMAVKDAQAAVDGDCDDNDDDSQLYSRSRYAAHHRS